MKSKKQICHTLTPDTQHAFKNLKYAFTSSPILKFPDPERAFPVEVNVSEVGIGEVLLQYQGDPEKLYPCVFFS